MSCFPQKKTSNSDSSCIANNNKKIVNKLNHKTGKVIYLRQFTNERGEEWPE